MKGRFINVWAGPTASDRVTSCTFRPNGAKGGIAQGRNVSLRGGCGRPEAAPEGKRCVCWGEGEINFLPSFSFLLSGPASASILRTQPQPTPVSNRGAESLLLWSHRPRAVGGEVENRSGEVKWSLQSMRHFSTRLVAFVVVISQCFTHTGISLASAWPISV